MALLLSLGKQQSILQNAKIKDRQFLHFDFYFATFVCYLKLKVEVSISFSTVQFLSCWWLCSSRYISFFEITGCIKKVDPIWNLKALKLGPSLYFVIFQYINTNINTKEENAYIQVYDRMDFHFIGSFHLMITVNH